VEQQDEVQGTTFTVAHQRDALQDPHHTPLLVEKAFLHLVGMDFTSKHLLKMFHIGI
jgi:hypothetical protein